MPRPNRLTADQRLTRAKIAAGSRHHPGDPATEKMAADFKADRAAQYLEQLVNSAPVLNEDQLRRLRVLLAGAAVK